MCFDAHGKRLFVASGYEVLAFDVFGKQCAQLNFGGEDLVSVGLVGDEIEFDMWSMSDGYDHKMHTSHKLQNGYGPGFHMWLPMTGSVPAFFDEKDFSQFEDVLDGLSVGTPVVLAGRVFGGSVDANSLKAWAGEAGVAEQDNGGRKLRQGRPDVRLRQLLWQLGCSEKVLKESAGRRHFVALAGVKGQPHFTRAFCVTVAAQRRGLAYVDESSLSIGVGPDQMETITGLAYDGVRGLLIVVTAEHVMECTESGRLRRCLQFEHRSGITGVAFDPESGVVYCAGDSGVYVVDLRSVAYGDAVACDS